MSRTLPTRVSILSVSLLPAALAVILLALSARPADAIFDKKFDWKNSNHKLKVCLKDAGCPAGMADSLKAAIGLWNAQNLTWTFEFVDDCANANITVSCATQGSLGATSADWNSKNNTTATVKISKGADWGWCDDKYELVSTLVHELGHCARLDDTPAKDQSKAMRGAQNKAGHSRGPAPDDISEAETSDTTQSIAMVTVPPGGQAGTVCTGMLTPAPGAPPFNLGHALFGELIPFDPTRLQILNVSPLGPEQVQWAGRLMSPGEDMQLMFLRITYPESTSVREGLVQVTDRPWSASWLPNVMAPPDTIVPTDTSDVILYHHHSSHPAGDEDDVMVFSWMIDGTNGVKGGPECSVRLPMGVHSVQLTGRDEMGVEGSSSMTVTVLATAGVYDQGPGRNPDGLRLAFPGVVHSTQSLTVTYTLPSAGRTSLRIYDLQGRQVASLLEGQASAGTHDVTWNLRNASAAKAAPGAYFVVLRTDRSMLTRRVLMLP